MKRSATRIRWAWPARRVSPPRRISPPRRTATCWAASTRRRWGSVSGSTTASPTTCPSSTMASPSYRPAATPGSSGLPTRGPTGTGTVSNCFRTASWPTTIQTKPIAWMRIWTAGPTIPSTIPTSTSASSDRTWCCGGSIRQALRCSSCGSSSAAARAARANSTRGRT